MAMRALRGVGLALRAGRDVLRFLLDAVLKLTPILVTLLLGLIAHGFQQEMSRTTLLSQREQAESQLRASMFRDLVEQVIGSQSSKERDLDRRRVAVELLALNFHEHFEAKPLLLDVDGELAPGQGRQTTEKARRARESLRSVARRVIDRQVAALAKEATTPSEKEGATETSADTQLARIQELTVTDVPKNPTQRLLFDRLREESAFVVTLKRQTPGIRSTDGKYELTVLLEKADWANEEFNVSAEVVDTQQGKRKRASDIPFTLTWFDFPLTDNTLLPDGNRFALALSRVDAQGTLRSVRIRAIWFPRGYFTARERPLDYRAFRKLVEARERPWYIRWFFELLGESPD